MLVEFLKEQIRDKEGYPIEDQRLFFGGKALEDGCTVGSYCIQKGAVLRLAVVRGCGLRGPIRQIYVKLPGKRITLDVSSRSLVEDVKAKIQEKAAIPSKEQRLVFAGMLLNDGWTLGEHNVEDSS